MQAERDAEAEFVCDHHFLTLVFPDDRSLHDVAAARFEFCKEGVDIVDRAVGVACTLGDGENSKQRRDPLSRKPLPNEFRRSQERTIE